MPPATVPCRKATRRAPASAPVTTPAAREGWEPPTATRRAGRRALRAVPERSVSKPTVRAKKAAVLPLSGKPPGSAPTRSKTQMDKGAKGRTAMRKIALDLGARETTYCEVQDGKVVDRGTVREIASLVAVLGPERPPATVAFEAGRQAWFVHDLLVGWHNEVVVVDTTRVKQLGVGQHGRKTNRIDAEVLARALEPSQARFRRRSSLLGRRRRSPRRGASVRRGASTREGRCRSPSDTGPGQA